MQLNRLIIHSGDNFAWVSSVSLSKQEKWKILDGEMFVPHEKIVVAIENKSAKLPDILGDSINCPVVSDKVKQILENSTNKKDILFLPCQLNIPCPNNFWVLIVTNHGKMDREKSQFSTFESGTIDEIEDLIFDEQSISDKDIFRLMEDRYHLFISDKLLSEFINKEVTGYTVSHNRDLTSNE